MPRPNHMFLFAVPCQILDECAKLSPNRTHFGARKPLRYSFLQAGFDPTQGLFPAVFPIADNTSGSVNPDSTTRSIACQALPPFARPDSLPWLCCHSHPQGLGTCTKKKTKSAAVLPPAGRKPTAVHHASAAGCTCVPQGPRPRHMHDVDKNKTGRGSAPGRIVGANPQNTPAVHQTSAAG